uniref:glutathione S-transferase 1-like n=1 Tax=Ciona intestinalis TaxID=7719 RepID=UPI000180CA2D|nr:glutathione S-transferase 1-like [Ciona intestinalis]|eukprot:XP_002125923.1 glutathione S-transferase 1-like [Ciona intestinalis]
MGNGNAKAQISQQQQQPQRGPVTFYSSVFSPPCRGLWMVLKASGVDFILKETDILSGEHKKPEYLAVNSLGTVPALKDGNLCIGESRAIMQYVCNRYAAGSALSLYPKDPAARAVVDQVLYFDTSLITAVYKYTKIAEVLFKHEKHLELDGKDEMKKKLLSLENFLSKNRYLAGDHMTIADLSVLANLVVLDICHFDDYEDFPKLKEWMKTMKALPYFEACCGKHNKAMTEMYQKVLHE